MTKRKKTEEEITAIDVNPLDYVTPKTLKVFWRKVRAAPDGCWLWTASVGTTGYGSFSFSIDVHTVLYVKAHRLSLAMAQGRWPKLYVLHSCDNRRCVNPAHLREGTQKENVQDAIQRGRKLPTPGISQETIDDIRDVYVEGASIGWICNWLGLSRPTVRKHVDPIRHFQDRSPDSPAYGRSTGVKGDYWSTNPEKKRRVG